MKHNDINAIYNKANDSDDEVDDIPYYTALLEEAGVSVIDNIDFLLSNLYTNDEGLFNNDQFKLSKVDLDKYEYVEPEAIVGLHIGELYMTCNTKDVMDVVDSSYVDKLYIKEGSTQWAAEAMWCNCGEVYLPSTLEVISGDVLPSDKYYNGTAAWKVYVNMTKENFSKVAITYPALSRVVGAPTDFYEKVECTDGKYTRDEALALAKQRA